MVEGLCRYGWTTLREFFRPDCCIAATKVAIRVLASFGYASRPLTVRLAVYTEKLAQRVMDGSWDGIHREGEWGVGVGFSEPESDVGAFVGEGWNGHLVAISGNWLIDLSLPQASRPLKGLHLPQSAAFLLSPGWKKDKHLAFAGNGLRLLYELHPEIKTFTTTKDWYLANRTEPVAKLLTEIIRKGGT